MILFRPVGLTEMGLIFDTGCEAFPPRLPEQPIFYPVLNFDYAAQIARDWNTKTRAFAGYVTRFEIDDNYAEKFDAQTVGGSNHTELWVPAEELDELNSHIKGKITMEAAFFGEAFEGCIPERFGMKGKNAAGQFAVLDAMFDYSPFDFYHEILTNSKVIFLHFPFWRRLEMADEDLKCGSKEKVLNAIRDVWRKHRAAIELPD